MTDIQLLEFAFGTVLGLLLGIAGTMIKVNSSYDNDIRNKTNVNIDDAVRDICAYFENPTPHTNQIMDYSVGSLVSDVRLKPILGSNNFDGSFSKLTSKLYIAAGKDPKELSKKSYDAHIKNINEIGVNLKRIVYIGSGNIRLFPKK